MKSILYDTKPTIRQMYLDPRTKILLCVTVSFVMIARRQYRDYALCASLYGTNPAGSIYYFEKICNSGLLCRTVYDFHYSPGLCNGAFSGNRKYLFTGIIAIFTKILPGMSMFSFLIITTTVSEFVAAMDSLHIPKSFTVPVSVMFRFFPTIKEEYSAIRDAMRLRNVGSWRNPMEMLEYRMVPLLTGTALHRQ